MRRTLSVAGLALLGAGCLAGLLHAALPLSDPRWLLALLLFVPAAPLWERWLRWRRRARRTLGLHTGNDSDAEEGDRALFTASAIVLLVVALAGPRWGAEVREYGHQPAELVVLLDVSLSMLAEDQGVSRLAAARAEVDTILHRLERERIALVPFAGIAWVQIPLTHDHGAVREAMLRLHPEDVPAQGTRISAAIREGAEGMHAAGERYRALVLLSDGEDHGGGARDAARWARAAGLDLHVIGVGRGDGAPIPRAGGEAEGAPDTLRDALGREVISRMDEALLRELAALGGGTYRPVDRPGSAGSALVEELRERNAAWLRERAVGQGADRRSGFLLAALACLLLGGRRRTGPLRPLPTADTRSAALPTRAGTLLLAALPIRAATLLLAALPIRAATLLLAALVLATGGGCSDRIEAERWEAIESLAAEGKVEHALEEMDALPARVRRRGAWSVNRGLLLLRQDPEAAQDVFLEALRRGEAGTRAAALVGLGQALAAQGEWRAAAERFAEALAVDADPGRSAVAHAVDADPGRPAEALPVDADPGTPAEALAVDADPGRSAVAAQNLRVAREMLHPPCERLAPTAGHAMAQAAEEAAERPEEAGGLVLCPERPDFHRLATYPGEELLVDVHFRRLRSLPGERPEAADAQPRTPRVRIATASAAAEDGDTPRAAGESGDALPGAIRGQALRALREGAPLPLLADARGEAWTLRLWLRHPQEEPARDLALVLESDGDAELRYVVTLHRREALGRNFLSQWLPGATSDEHAQPEESAEAVRDPGIERDWRALLDSLPAEGNLPLERALRRAPIDPASSPW